MIFPKIFRTMPNTRYMLYIAAATASLSAAASSVHLFWPSPALVALQSEDSPIGRPITDEEGSWVVSLEKLGIITSAFIGVPMIEKLGRKNSMLIMGVFLFLPWFLLAFAQSVWFLYTARFISGMAIGVIVISRTIYLGEIAENDIRGELITYAIILKVIGALCMLCVGPYLSYRDLSLVGAIIPAIFLITFVFMPESPYFLVKTKKREKAEGNLRILSSNLVDDKFINNRMTEIEKCVEEDMKNKTTLWEFFSNPDYRKAIIIMFGLKSLHQLSGEAAIVAYMQTIMSLTKSSISDEVSSMIFGFIQLPAVLTSGLLVDKIGRKPLLIISALGSAIALFAEGLFFYFQDFLEADVSSMAWLPTTGMALFLFMNPLGVIPLPYVLMGEIFPTNIKEIAASVITLYAAILTFIVSKFFKPLANAWGMYTIFWFFGSVCVLGTVFIVFVLPETKGKSFVEIQTIFRNKKRDGVVP